MQPSLRWRRRAPISSNSRIEASMWEGAAILLIAAGLLLWADSLKARERAVRAGRSACERYRLQFLDDTVSFARMRLARNHDGELRIAAPTRSSSPTPATTGVRARS